MKEDEKSILETTTNPFVKTFSDTHAKHEGIFEQKQSYRLRSGLVTLPPGESVGEHSTEDHEELVIALSGKGEIEAEGLGRANFGEGQVAYNPPNTKHNVINTGNRPLKYIYVVTKVL